MASPTSERMYTRVQEAEQNRIEQNREGGTLRGEVKVKVK